MKPITGVGPFPTRRKLFEAGSDSIWNMDFSWIDGLEFDDEEVLEYITTDSGKRLVRPGLMLMSRSMSLS
jgi:hypothetical protein